MILYLILCFIFPGLSNAASINSLTGSQDFTTLGARRLHQDVIAIDILAYSGGAMRKLYEGVTLLNLPINNEVSGGASLMDASNAIFASASEADAMLETLGLHIITKQEARSILQKRREAIV